MKSFVCLLTCCSALAASDALARLLDAKRSVSQRADACFELRGDRSPAVLAAMRKTLETDSLRACAGRNLREAGAIDLLKNALGDDSPDVRAIAARELGAFGRPDLLDALSKAGRDANVMVATSAVQGLSEYQIPGVVPYLLDVAKSGGMPGMMALRRAAQFKDPAVLPLARQLLARADATLRLDAIRILGDLGEPEDLAVLEQIAAKKEQLSPAGRGFGLMPGVDLSRAADNAAGQIRTRAAK